MSDSIGERARRDASGIAAVLVTGTWLALLMLGVPNNIWLAVMLFGYIAVVPLAGMLFEEDEKTEQSTDRETESTATEAQTAETALERIRRRYAEGELTDEQFEQKLERLLETETLEDVETYVATKGRDRRQSSDRIEGSATVPDDSTGDDERAPSKELDRE